MFIGALREAGWKGLCAAHSDRSETAISLPQTTVALSNVFQSPNAVVHPEFLQR